MRSHLVVSLLLVIGLSFFGGKTNVLQASLNISMLNEISIEEFQTLEDKPVHIYIDNSLERFEVLYAAAGHPNCVFRIDYTNLEKITNGLVKDISE